MLSLNLVSEELKKEIKLRHVYSVLKRVVIILIVFLVFSSLILSLSSSTLEYYFEEAAYSDDQNLDRATKYESEIRRINTKIKSIANIQKDYKVNSIFIENFLDYSSDDVIFSSISIDWTEKTVEISGNSKTREALLNFKNDMENFSRITEVNIPANLFIKKQDINFTMHAKIID